MESWTANRFWADSTIQLLALEDVGVIGEYHVVAALYVEGGGQIQPVPGVDYLASSEKLALGEGKAEVALEMAPSLP